MKFMTMRAALGRLDYGFIYRKNLPTKNLKNVSVESSKDTVSTLTVLAVSTPIKKMETISEEFLYSVIFYIVDMYSCREKPRL